MGTRVDIIGWGGNGMAIVNAIVEVVARHEDLWSVFRVSSEVSRLNSVVASDGGDEGISRDAAESAEAGPGLVVVAGLGCEDKVFSVGCVLSVLGGVALVGGGVVVAFVLLVAPAVL